MCSVVPLDRGQRRAWRLWALGALAVACHAAEDPPASSATAPPPSGGPRFLPESTYLVIYRPGAQWPADGSPPPALRDHFRYLLELHRSGTLRLAGPFGSETGGAALLHAPDDAAALALLRADPAVTAQIFDFEVRRWRLVDWAAPAASPSK